MSSIRTFIALPASSDAQQKIAAIQSKLKTSHADVKWDAPDKFHLTLKFLGNVELPRIEMLKMHLEKITRSFPGLSLIYDSLGVFPSLISPRVVWIGARPDHELLGLHYAIDELCSKHGFPKEERSFHPHITLGRTRGTRNIVHLTEAIKTITFEAINFNCSEVLLMKSDLHQGGSVYSILSSFPLNS
jgi:RNA 2',3'-cyclic 3'-phosphodiesterase